MKQGRKILEEYLESGNYVFHGTEKKGIETFKPFQAYNQNEKGEKYKDGLPAIFASITIEIPIFFAIFNHVNIDLKGSSFGVGWNDGEITLRATKNKIDFFAENKIEGYVYVFEKKLFTTREHSTSEMVCEVEVKPVAIVKVMNEDVVLEINKI